MEEKPAPSVPPEIPSSLPDFTSHWKRTEEVLARHEQEKQKQVQLRRGERSRGEMSSAVADRLRNCSIGALEEAKRYCNFLIARQRNPPKDSDCPSDFVVKVLIRVGVRNRLYRVELRRTTMRADRIYINGPYVYAYWWDGAIVRPKYFRQKELSSKLPRRVWAAIKRVSEWAANRCNKSSAHRAMVASNRNRKSGRNLIAQLSLSAKCENQEMAKRKKIVMGTCKMCLTEEVRLQDSHFMPKGIYKALRIASPNGNTNPVLLTSKEVKQTSKQVKAHLLCSRCEERLGKNGEDWVMRNGLKNDGQFKLLSAATEKTFACAHTDFDALTVFAM